MLPFISICFLVYCIGLSRIDEKPDSDNFETNINGMELKMEIYCTAK